MNKFYHGFEFILAYIDNLRIITTGDLSNHLEKLELTLKNLKDKTLKCNIETLSFGKPDMEYLGFWVTRNGIRPVNKKIRSHSKYDSTKKSKTGARTNNLSELL